MRRKATQEDTEAWNFPCRLAPCGSGYDGDSSAKCRGMKFASEAECHLNASRRVEKENRGFKGDAEQSTGLLESIVFRE